MIIFNELKYAEWLLKQNRYKVKDLYLLSRYYRYLEMTNSQIQEKIIEFCRRYNSDFNEVVNRDLIKSVVNHSNTHKLKLGMSVGITQTELEIIKNQKDTILEKLLFVLLVLGKYNKKLSKSEYEDFYVSQEIKDIFLLAKVKGVSDSGKHKYFAELNRRGLIRTTPRNRYEIKFVDKNSEYSIEFELCQDFIYYYEKSNGIKIINCERCGKLMKEYKNRKKYCNDCWKEKQLEWQRNSMKKSRNVK